MLGIQIARHGAAEGIWAIVYGENEGMLCVVDIYKINREAVKKPAEDMMLRREKFSGREAWPRAVDYLEQVCGNSPDFMRENERVFGNGFAADCLRKILTIYPDNFYSENF